ncbi:MAG: hypothetical protein IPK82_17600 [Polyangiaceae bacterium]|nr:hypothetical protein [Polyangiaceae bacterium]
MAMRSSLTALLALVFGFAPGMLACDGSGTSSGVGGDVSTSSSSTASNVGGGGAGGNPTSSSTGGTGGSAGSGGTVAPFCGDGIANGGEECDGPDLKSADCTGYGFSTKSGVTCTSDCKLDPSGCKATCNGVLLEPGEECDGVNLGNHDCTEFGFTKKGGKVQFYLYRCGDWKLRAHV